MKKLNHPYGHCSFLFWLQVGRGENSCHGFTKLSKILRIPKLGPTRDTRLCELTYEQGDISSWPEVKRGCSYDKTDYKIVESYSTKKLYKFMALKIHSNSKDSQSTVEHNLFSNFSIKYFASYRASKQTRSILILARQSKVIKDNYLPFYLIFILC